MKLTIALLATLTGTTAFLPSRPTPHHTHSTAPQPPKALNAYQIGFEIDAPTPEQQDSLDALEQVRKFIPNPTPVVQRPDLGTSVLISGFNPQDPSSSMALDFLNNEDSTHLPFTRVIAHVEDVKLAKKRMIGRNARYTGLLDKLSFLEAAGDDGSVAAVPSLEELEGVSSWVAHVGDGDLSKLNAIVEMAEAAPSVKNVSILISGAQSLGDIALREAEDMLKSKTTTFAYTLLAVGEWNEEPEASCAYGLRNVTDVEAGGSLIGLSETFSREESLRLVTECLAIDKASGLCLVANASKNVTSSESRLIRGMREAGYTRHQEVEFMVTKGVKGYNDMLQQEAEQSASRPLTPEEIEEAKREEEEQKKIRQEEYKQASLRALEPYAKEWAEMQYERQYNLKTMIMSKEAFVKTIWDRALFESELHEKKKWGKEFDEDAERKAFKERQEREREEKRKRTEQMLAALNYDDVIKKPRETERAEKAYWERTNEALREKMESEEADKELMEKIMLGLVKADDDDEGKLE